MDWARAIEINRAALTRIVLGLIAMVGGVEVLPQPLYRAVARVLRPAESAVRRLIVIAARGLKVKPLASRPMPKGRAIARKGSGRISFALFDMPKRFGVMRRTFAKAQPRIRVIEFITVFQPKDFVSSPAVPEPDPQVDAQRLVRRLAAVKLALDTLPRQAMRLARWRARQTVPAKPPLRLGPPPGHRVRAQDEVDFVLRECHALARDALEEDTS